MKVLIIGSEERYQKFLPDTDFARDAEKIFVPRDASPAEILAAGRDASYLLADAVSAVPAEVIDGMPNLRMIHSEGVAYNAIDIEAARRRGIPVCNNKGANATAVAEQAVLMMLGVLRHAVPGHRAVLEGRQMAVKERSMVEGITELRDCRVGLVGFGDIGRATARLLRPFGCELVYYARHRADPKTEEACGAVWLPLEELLATSDIVSLHVPVTPETAGMMDARAFSRMKPGAVLINTARGELVENQALIDALASGRLSGAGLDTVAPEPVLPDNPLVTAPEEVREKIFFSPHLGGITTSTFRRVHANLWRAIQTVEEGGEPDNIVNR